MFNILKQVWNLYFNVIDKSVDKISQWKRVIAPIELINGSGSIKSRILGSNLLKQLFVENIVIMSVGLIYIKMSFQLFTNYLQSKELFTNLILISFFIFPILIFLGSYIETNISYYNDYRDRQFKINVINFITWETPPKKVEISYENVSNQILECEVIQNRSYYDFILDAFPNYRSEIKNNCNYFSILLPETIIKEYGEILNLNINHHEMSLKFPIEAEYGLISNDRLIIWLPKYNAISVKGEYEDRARDFS